MENARCSTLAALGPTRAPPCRRSDLEAWRGRVCVSILILAIVAARGEDVPPSPPQVNRKVNFDTAIQPIFQQHCLRCHGAARAKGGFRLDEYAAFLRGGQDGPVVQPGDSTNSMLIRLVAGLDPDSVMPPEEEDDALTAEQVGLLREWVDQGAWWGRDVTSSNFNLAISPAAGFTAVDGNEAKFRQLNWQRDQGRGGVESFELWEQVSPQTKYALSGHLLTDDYLARMRLEQQDRGSARFGFEQFRKYDVDTGGYFPDFTPSVFSLDRDLHLDVGRAWADFDLAVPDWPRLLLGYEFLYRTGDKATLQWGTVTDGVEARNIYPASKEIDEHTHVLKFTFDYAPGDWRVVDDFRGEWTDANTRQLNTPYVDLTTPGFVVQDNVRQGWQAFVGANTLRVERRFRPWLFSSAGYLYSHLSGDAEFSLDQSVPDVATLRQYTAQQITLERQSQVANGNLVMGPWQGGTLTLGVQGEWTRQNGDLDGTEFVNPADATNRVSTEIDKVVVDESVGLRYTRLPATALYVEGRLQQESLGQTEDEAGNLPLTFLRDTDAQSQAYEVRVGFDSSPRPWIQGGASYRWRDRSSTYDGAAYDNSFPPLAIQGYPAFILGRDLNTQEIEARLKLRPNAWFKTTFTWRWLASDFHTTTKSATINTPNDATPGGETFAGDYDAQMFSVNFSPAPWRRFSSFATVSYQTVQSTTVQDPTSAVVPYRGDTWSVLAHGRFVWTKTTDLTAGYTFSSAGFQQNNFSTGLPLGIEYRMHGLRIGLISHWSGHLTTKLEYGFYHYTEPSSGGANDFTANAVFASLSWRLN